MATHLPRVLVVEDEAPVARAIARALREHAEVIKVLSAHDARTVIRTERPFTIVTDVHLKDGSGFDLIDEARMSGAGEAALLISGDEELVNQAWERKVDFLLKPVAAHLLVRFVSEAGRRERAREFAVVDALDHWERAYGLTRAEKEVLAAALSGRTRKEIAAVLGKSEETVKTHIHHLLEKTKCDSVLAMVSALLRQAMESLKD